MSKLFIIGNGPGCGKDTLAEILNKKIGLRFDSSSVFMIRKFLFKKYCEEVSGEFETPEELHKARLERQDIRNWLKEKICEFNKDNKTRLAEELFKQYDIYVGIRDYWELRSAKEKWEDALVIYVDGQGRVEDESISSQTVKRSQADILITNQKEEEDFFNKAERLSLWIGGLLNVQANNQNKR